MHRWKPVMMTLLAGITAAGVSAAQDQDDDDRQSRAYNCPGLQQGDTLMYRTTVGQVCDLDIVTVLEDWGFGYSPGASCGLGMFHPITEQIADELLQAKR